MPDRDRPLYAVLIDAENIPAKFAEAIVKEITTFGEPALRRVYGDWSNDQLGKWSQAVRELGMVAHQETSNTKGKNAADIGLVIDAMDILHTGRFDGFVLVSSDSDFTALANRIREQGLDVIGIGEAKAPESLRNVCNRFILIENISRATSSSTGRGAGKMTKDQAAEAARLIRTAMDKLDVEGEWYPLGRIGQQILADKPDFDFRSYGKSKLADLVEEIPAVELKREGNHVHVRRLD